WACCSFRRGAAASPTIYSLSLHDALPIFLYFGILNQLRRMVWLTAGVDDDRAMAAPMLEFDKAADTMNIVRRVASRKGDPNQVRSEEHTSELQSRENLVCRLLLEKKKHNQ